MDSKRHAIEPLIPQGDDDLCTLLDELEDRLEQQLAMFPIGSEDEPCLWYFCNPKCEGTKCITVCPVAHQEGR